MKMRNENENENSMKPKKRTAPAPPQRQKIDFNSLIKMQQTDGSFPKDCVKYVPKDGVFD